MTTLAPDKVSRDPARLFACPDIEVERRADGVRIVRSRVPVPEAPRAVNEWLLKWARQTPDRDFLCERESVEPGAPWRRQTYAQALDDVKAIAAWMLDNGLGPERPVAVLSDNGIDHAMIVLAGSHVGVPVASVSVAYSLMSKDHAKLKEIIKQLAPGAIFVADAAPFAGALKDIEELHEARIIAGNNATAGMISLAEVKKFRDEAAVEAAYAKVGPDTIAKILFTSGSTGEPKGVVNTQRMLTVPQEAKAHGWKFLNDGPVVTLDWLPWSHTFGANHNFNMVLRSGGTMYIDNGKPAPGILQRTLANIRDVPSNVYFNVPRGFDLLAAEMKKDKALREAFFRNLQIVFYAGAALPQTVWDDYNALAEETIGERVVLTSAWGSTETAPLATDCHFQAEKSGNIGVPPPGVELKFVPNAGKDEIRVRGPNVTPGYWKRPDLTQAAFDEEGFYKIGDAVRFADESDPGKGIFFDGRVSEDFKLTSGTWVSVGALRVKAVEMLAPLAQDIVIAGHDRAEIGFLVFANPAACRAVAGAHDDTPLEKVLADPKVVSHLRDGLAALKQQGGGSSTYAARAILMAEPPSVDAGEITDKGYVNQRAVLTRRAALVEKLYAGGEGVIVP
ncbi:MAG: feruloyl-CoA synthase [Beijerinckiaceae bacterium]